jgi:Ion channel
MGSGVKREASMSADASGDLGSAKQVWRPGSRMARLRASHSYGTVLVLIASSFVFIAAAPDSDWAVSVLVLLQCATLLLALITSGLGQDRRPAIPLAVIAGVAAISVHLFQGDTSEGVVALIDALLVAAAIAVVGLGVVDQGEVNAQSIMGALCIYLLLGMFFTFAYNAVALLGEGAFFANGSDGTPFERLYFSYVTLATLGYGDYTAGGTLGRSLAVFEVLLGQLFLVTAVALLVGILVAGRQRPPDSQS